MSFITPSTTLPKSHYPNNKTAGIPKDSGFLFLSFYFGEENKKALLLSVHRSFFMEKRRSFHRVTISNDLVKEILLPRLPRE